MDQIMGVATGLAVISMAKQHDRAKRSGKFGDMLIAEGGDAAAIGERWNAGAALIDEGKGLAGWFVGRAQNKLAEALITEGIEMQKIAENDYEALQSETNS